MMRKSQVEKLIRDDIQKIVPVNQPNFDLKAIIPDNEVVKTKRQVQFPRLAFRTLAMVMSLAIVVVLALTLSNGFGQVTTTTTTITTTDTLTTPTTPLNPITEVNAKEYALPIITASQLSFGLSSLSGTGLSFKLADGPLLMDDHIDLVNQYMNALETTLSLSDSNITQLESDLEDYEYLVQISSFNVLLEDYNYLLYYNVTQVEDEEISMAGQVIWNGRTSNFIGEFEDESDEQKLMITTYDTDVLEDNYIKTEFVVEDEEMKYQIEVYEDGEKVSSSDIEIETEEDESKINVAMMDGTDIISFEINKELEDDNYEIKVSYQIESSTDSESGEMNVKIIYNEIEDQYYYSYDVTSEDITKNYLKDRILNSSSNAEEQHYTL